MNDDLKKAAYAEEKAEVEVLFAALSKFNDINKRLAASRNRVEESGRIIDESIRPIYGNTQKLQIMNTSKALSWIDGPVDNKDTDARQTSTLSSVRSTTYRSHWIKRIMRSKSYAWGMLSPC